MRARADFGLVRLHCEEILLILGKVCPALCMYATHTHTHKRGCPISTRTGGRVRKGQRADRTVVIGCGEISDIEVKFEELEGSGFVL